MKYCRGCYTKSRCICIEYFIIKTIKCPCSICIVKAVCNTTCGARRSFARKVIIGNKGLKT